MTTPAPSTPQQPWFAAKCLFSHPSRADNSERFLYEERTTLWRANSFAEAFALAEAEAVEYARDSTCVFVRATDSFHLFDESIGHGSEIWSLMRGSGMEPELYAETFCATSPPSRRDITTIAGVSTPGKSAIGRPPDGPRPFNPKPIGYRFRKTAAASRCPSSTARISTASFCTL